MPYIEDRGGLDFNGNNPWKGYPVAIVDRVLNITCGVLGCRKTDVLPDSQFVRDLGIDSLDDVEIVLRIEDAFSIAIADEEAEKLITVGQLVHYVKDRIG